MAIPIYERQLSESGLPSARVENAAGPDAFGAGVGRAVQGFAAAFQAKAEEFEDAQTLEAFNAFQRDVNAYHFDPDKGIYNTRLGKDADGVYEDADAHIDNLMWQYSGKMKSPRMTQNFMRMASGVRESQGKTNMLFQAKQIDSYRDAEANASIEMALNNVGLNYNDDDAVTAIMDQALPALELKLRGAGDEVRKAALQELKDKVTATRVQHMLQDDPMAAQAWFEKNKEDVSAAMKLKIGEAIDGEVDRKTARLAADAFWGQYGEDEEGARAAIYGSDLKDEVKDAVWNRYQARASDNSRFQSERERAWFDSWYTKIGEAGSAE